MVGLKHALLVTVLRLAVLEIHRISPGLVLRGCLRDLLHDRRPRGIFVNVRLNPCLLVCRAKTQL